MNGNLKDMRLKTSSMIHRDHIDNNKLKLSPINLKNSINKNKNIEKVFE